MMGLTYCRGGWADVSMWHSGRDACAGLGHPHSLSSPRPLSSLRDFPLLGWTECIRHPLVRGCSVAPTQPVRTSSTPSSPILPLGQNSHNGWRPPRSVLSHIPVLIHVCCSCHLTLRAVLALARAQACFCSLAFDFLNSYWRVYLCVGLVWAF
jgi:hypothetical protein